MDNYLITEFSTSILSVRPEFIPNLRLMFTGEYRVETDKHTIGLEGKSVISSPDDDIASVPSNSIAIIPIIGPMAKYGCYQGMDNIAETIRRIDQAPNIAGSILLFNTPGGTTQSLIQLEDALSKRRKPCSAVVDGMCCSCGIYVASFCDHIFATNPMCEVGSIGVYISLLNADKFFEDLGVKFIDVYPPESSRKNLPYREALKGNPDLLIEESLRPFALHFQNVIKANRKGLDLACDGILEGRVFYAQDAVNNGLIDGIKSINEAVDIVLGDAADYNSIINLKF